MYADVFFFLLAVFTLMFVSFVAIHSSRHVERTFAYLPKPKPRGLEDHKTDC